METQPGQDAAGPVEGEGLQLLQEVLLERRGGLAALRLGRLEALRGAGAEAQARAFGRRVDPRRDSSSAFKRGDRRIEGDSASALIRPGGGGRGQVRKGGRGRCRSLHREGRI